MKKFSKINHYQKVNQIVIDGLKKSGLQWFKAWTNSSGDVEHPINRNSKRAYSGVNVFLLNATCMQFGYTSNEWLTYVGAKKLGGQVRRGEKSTCVVRQNISFLIDGKWYFENKIPVGKTKHDAEKVGFNLVTNAVFNVDQIDGVEPCREIKEDATEDNLDVKPIDTCEKIISDYVLSSKVIINELPRDRACYFPSIDVIHMPKKEQFAKKTSVDDYYKTLFHEMIHSTGHESRLNRFADAQQNDKVAYSKEELVAEIGAMYLVSVAKINPIDNERNSQAYINGWIKYIKTSHEKSLISAMTQAQKGVKLILTNS